MLTLSLPMEDGKLLAAMDAEDIGRSVLPLFKGGERFIGETVSVAGDHLTGAL